MDTLNKEKRKLLMSKIKTKNTSPEIIVRKALHAYGFRFRIHQVNLPGKPDIVLKKHKTIVFVHGCFWHQHKDCKKSTLPKSNINFWREKLEKNVVRDKQQINELEQLGWRVVIIWECEVKKESFSEKILQIRENNC